MNIQKVRTVKTPQRGTPGSAGLDFFVPNLFERTILEPGLSINIPSGIVANIPKGHVLIAFNKSGVALKKGLQVGACVIDEDYQGEIHLHLTNIGLKLVEIKPRDKLVQFVLLPVVYPDVKVVQNDLFSQNTERGSGGFGSTGE